MENDKFIYPHILLANTAISEPYTSPLSGPRKPFRTPQRNRVKHSQDLLHQLDQANREATTFSRERSAIGIAAEEGIYLSFASDADYPLKLESLEATASGIELVAVRQDVEKRTWATVYVPEGKLTHFIKKVEAYRDKETKKGKPKNQSLMESISEIRRATLEGLWTDDRSFFPQEKSSIWWEVWLRSGKDKGVLLSTFRQHAPRMGLKVSNEMISFPERTVLLAYGDTGQMTRSLDLLNCIAEVRKAKDNPEIFMHMPPPEQTAWINDALARISRDEAVNTAVCILDTGINRNHPLLDASLAQQDMNTYNPSWGTADHHGHGTEMAGLALYGDLVDLLTGHAPVPLSHCLESVKILPPVGHNDNDPRLYGDITKECISRAEITAPNRKRITVMAVTAPDFRDRGRPSSWSAAIDQLTADIENGQKRLLVLSAGNTDFADRHHYPHNNYTEDIHDPAQAWNALCVSAYTEKTEIDQSEYPGWHVIAPAGGLSPSSCTSSIWSNPWPIKPDIVMEGGNCAINPGTGQADTIDSLQLLTTNWQPLVRPLTITGDTSAASSLAARMAAMIQAEYPAFWPETVRALMVHSADWTDAMTSMLTGRNRREVENLLQCYGYGVPDLTRALRSAANSLTLIVQDEMQPFDRIDGQYKTCDINFHQIPWPTDVLKSLDVMDVEMRVTLSYFMEPNPAARGWQRKHTYHSHGLRFDVKTPDEDIDQFRWRVNKAARDEEEHLPSKSDASKWVFGPQIRSRGSIHTDRWKGPAIELAQRGYIAVYPVTGWWKERHHLGRWSNKARYSLIVTISTPETEVDIYTPVVNMVSVVSQI